MYTTALADSPSGKDFEVKTFFMPYDSINNNDSASFIALW